MKEFFKKIIDRIKALRGVQHFAALPRKRKILTVVAFVLALALVCGAVFLLIKPKGMAHYLLIGIDGWGLNVEGAGRSDVIMIASLDYDTNRVVLTSLARDSLVEPSWRSKSMKLNTLVRSSEGEAAIVRYVEETYAIALEGYFAVNFSGAVDIIDAIGGVTIDLTKSEVRYLKKHAGDYDGYLLHEGDCRMNGAQALAYMRCRELDNDFGRQNRQGKTLRALMDELSSIGMGKAVSLVNVIMEMYRTDLSVGEQVALAKNAVYLRKGALEHHTIPAEGTYRFSSTDEGASALRFNLDENRALLYSWLRLALPEAWTQEK